MSLEKNLRQYGTKLLLASAAMGLAVCFFELRSLGAADQPGDARMVEAKATTGTSSQLSLRTPTPGTAIYETRRGDTVISVARHYLAQTSYLTSSQLAQAIRESNRNLDGTFLKPGQQLSIPGIIATPILEKAISVPKDFEVRAIYLTGLMAGSDRGVKIVRRWREAGGNAVVFDIKDSDGTVNIPFEHPLLGSHKVYIHDLAKYTRFLNSQGLHAIARIAMFRDQRLVLAHPELAVRSKKSGQPWRENGKLVWTDPSRIEVQEYDIALAQAAAAMGVDEIQFDYVRFPAEGEQTDAAFSFQKTHSDWQRSDVIADFLRRAYTALHPKGVLLSLDVFGVMAWQRPVDLAHTGQDIVRMAKYCDVLSPMIYPSHFFGMDGYAKPGDAPEHFIGESMDRFVQITAGSGVVIRPWLQAFAWRTKTYSPKYIEVQVLTAKNKGGIGFLFWNANNDYTKPYAAMPEMKASKGQYFRGDEISTLRASLGTPPTDGAR
ncbi:MAG: LysM peptidoglycan-binding domain-containing protein [Acidobacteria bacterium]|nr:LysM peptidoglycan-binding domain-containing protein [Acidobacteriota bacterium]